MLMGTHDRAVDHRVLIVSVGTEVLEQFDPDAAHGPATEPDMHRFPVAEPLWQIAPRDARSVAKQHRLDKQPIILRRHPDVALTAGQQVLDPQKHLTRCLPNRGQATMT